MGRPLRLIGVDHEIEKIVKDHGPITVAEIVTRMRADGLRWPTLSSPYRHKHGDTEVTAIHVRSSLRKNQRCTWLRGTTPPQWVEWERGR